MSGDWCFEFPDSEEEHAFDWSNASDRQEMGRSLVKTLEQMIQGYHAKVDEEGVDVKIARKPRKGRRVQQTQKTDARSQKSDGPQQEVKVGTQKMTAIKNILMGCTPKSYKDMVLHMSVTEGEAKSALTDSVLAVKWIFPGTPPPEGQVPTDLEELARRQAATTALKLIPAKLMMLASNCSVEWLIQ